LIFHQINSFKKIENEEGLIQVEKYITSIKVKGVFMDDIFSNGGYFDDDGNQLNPDLIPKPGLCLLCKLNDDTDPEENILCNLNRLGQVGELEFKCGTFIPLNEQ
jgi:hypothetical protein